MPTSIADHLASGNRELTSLHAGADGRCAHLDPSDTSVRMPAGLEPTAVSLPGGARTRTDAILLVLGDGHFSTHALAAGQTLVVGRDDTCEVALDHPKISRRHAIVRAGTPATVEDAGSTNGVRVAGRRLAAGERAALTSGTSFHVGPFEALVLGAPSPVGQSQDGRAALVVQDPRPDALSAVVQRVAVSDVSVLIQGETGVGKELLANAIHARSGRSGPLLGINCAALSESLLESELFGHERGAFTGATSAKPGLFEAAARGTVFLDEIGDMPLGIQAKLLRAIEARQVTPVGAVRPIDLDVRFVAATHRDLRAEIASGRFREDLFFRIDGITLNVPPLRERHGGILALARELLAAAAARAQRKPPTLSRPAADRLVHHSWPGNVRELKAVLERALLLASGDSIDREHVLIDTPAVVAAIAPAARVADFTPAERAERDRIVAALDACAGNQTHAAKRLGISRATLVTKVGFYRLPRPRKR
jgi:two-component system, NtrC family, response regulator AtoC